MKDQKTTSKSKPLKKRYMLGLKEVSKHLNADNLTMVILATNLENVEEAKGTNELVTNIAIQCRKKNIPLVFAMNRFRLGCASKFKGQLVSAVGIRSF